MKDKTYFTEIASVDPHFIIAGHTDDICCNDSLQITTVEYELHRHLKEQGFEAVVFYNRNLKIYTYDRQSFDIVRQIGTNRSSGDQNSSRTSGEVDLRNDGPLGIRLDEPEQEPSTAHSEPVDACAPLCLRELDVVQAWTMISDMLKGERKTALVVSNMNAMTQEEYINQFPANALAILTELGEISSRNHSIAIYTFRGLDFAELERQTTGSSDEWSRFMEACIRPLICRNSDGVSAGGTRRHIIRIDFPNAAEIRNLLLHFQLRENDPLIIKGSDIEETALNLAYGCATESIVLKELYNRIENYIRTNPSHCITPDNCHVLVGRKNNNTALSDLEELIGLDEAKRKLSLVYGYARQEGFENVGMPDDSSRFSPMPDAVNFSHGVNVCLIGERGTGKTEIANLLGRIYYEAGVLPTPKVIKLQPSDITGGNVGDAGRRMAEAVQRAMGGVLFIDEAYGLSERESLGAGTEAITRLVGDMTAYKGRFAVVLAGYEDRMEQLFKDNEGLNSRFPEQNFLYLKPYSWQEIMQILRYKAEKHSKDVGFVPDSEENGFWLANFCENWVGDRDEDWGNAREAENLLQAMKQLYAERAERIGAEKGSYLLSCEDIPEKLRCHLRSKTKNLEEALKKLQNLIGLENPKRFLLNLCATIKWDKEKPEPGSFLFLGAPGTGKTYFAETMCEILHHMGIIRRRNPVIYNAGDLIHGKIGVEALVKKARGTMLFIDEAHQLSDTNEGRRVIRELVPLIENPSIRADTCFVLAGYQDEMMHFLSVDSGLESRFEEKNRIRFVNYTSDELVKLLEMFLKQRGYRVDENRGYLNRSLAALNRYLDHVDNNFGNARFIRKEFLDNSIARRTKRLNKTHLTDVEESEREYAVPDDKTVESAGDTRLLTELDIPENMESFAGPVGMPPQPARTAEVRLSELVGKQSVKEYIEAFKASSATPEFFDSVAAGGMHFVISGPAGSGRHTVAQTLASYLYEAGKLCNERPISRSKGDFEGEYVGHTVPKTRDVINSARGSMLIVENPSSMLQGSKHNTTFGVEALATIVGAMSQYSDISIVFIDTADGIDALIKSVNGIRDKAKLFSLEDMSPSQMQQIFEKKTENSMCFDKETEEILSSFFLNWVSDRGGLGEKTSAWANGNEIESLIGELRDSWVRLGGQKVVENNIPRREITRAMFPEAMQKYLVSTMVNHKTALKELDDMTGLSGVKDAIHKIERRLRNGDKSCTIPGCYCFLGNPGTGKTTVARKMGGVLKATGVLEQGHVIERSASSFANDPSLYDEALKLAKNGILFIDEAHQMLKTAGGQEVIRRLVRDLEDINILKVTSIILAGYPAEMQSLIKFDRGLTRRFGNESSIIYFSDYTPTELLTILNEMAKKAGKIPQICAPCKIELTDGYVGAALRVFEKICAMKKPDFGNGGFVRSFLNDSVDCMLERKDGEENIIYQLDKEDIPEKYRKMIAESRSNAKLSETVLSVKDHEGDVTRNSMKDYAERVTVYLSVYKDGQRIGSGTGVIITESGHILTCAHVIENADSVRAKLYCPGNIGGDTIWKDCEILSPVASDIDMAVLKMEGSNFPVANLRHYSDTVNNLEEIMITGYSLGDTLNGGNTDALSVSHKFGCISSIQTAVNKYFCDIRALHGDSGAPVFSLEDGKVIGVFTGAVAPNKESRDEFNFFHPIGAFWQRFVL